MRVSPGGDYAFSVFSGAFTGEEDGVGVKAGQGKEKG
jgi:hypothetical protein